MGVFVKGNRWYIDYYVNSKRKREVVGHVDNITMTIAEKALKARMGEIVQGKFNLERTFKPILFDQLIERYLEYAMTNHRSYKRDITICKVLLKSFHNIQIANINSWHVEKFKSRRKEESLALSTINRELTVFKRMFNLAIQWNLTTQNPVKGVKFFKIPLQKPRVLSEKEFQTLYKFAPSHLKPVLHVAISTGMRKGEILNLKWEDIDFENGFIVVRDSKNYESRTIPMNNDIKKALIKLKENGNSEYLFCYKEDKPIEYIYRSFGTALRSSGIPYCTFHCLRHTFATRAVMAGVDIVTVQELLGHKTISMTKRYSHPTPEHKKKAVELVSIDTSLDTSSPEVDIAVEEQTNVTVLNN